jgi:hypothetical protein
MCPLSLEEETQTREIKSEIERERESSDDIMVVELQTKDCQSLQ